MFRLQTEAGSQALGHFRAVQFLKRLRTRKFPAAVVFQDFIIGTVERILAHAFYIVFQMESRHIEEHVLEPEASTKSVHRVNVIAHVGVVFYEDFIIRPRNNPVFKIQKATRVIHLVIAVTNEFHTIQPDLFRIGNNRNKTARFVQVITFALPLHAAKRPRITCDLVRSPSAAHLGPAITQRRHSPQRRTFERCQPHRMVIPRKIAQVEHGVRRFHPKINLIDILERCRGLVSRLAIDIRQKRVYINAIGKPPLNRKPQFLIDLRAAIAHGHLHRLVAMRLDFRTRRILRVRSCNKIHRMSRRRSRRIFQHIWIPYRQRIHI